MEPLPAPTPLPAVGVPPQGRIGPRRQPDQQLQTASPTRQGEHILPRRQKSEASLAGTQQVPAPAVAAPSRPQADPVRGTAARQARRQSAQQIGRKSAQVLRLFFSPAQAEAFPCLKPAYCSIFALTRYCPAVTPPNRYIPWLLVLVVAARVSTWVSPVPVT